MLGFDFLKHIQTELKFLYLSVMRCLHVYSFGIVFILLGFISSAQGLPTASFSIPTASICLNQSLVCSDLSTNNPTNYIWYVTGASIQNQGSPFANITFTSTGTQTIYLTASNSAGSSTNAATQTVMVHPLPNVTAFTSATLIGQGFPFTLSAGGAHTYTWQTFQVGTVVYPAQTGSIVSVIINKQGIYLMKVFGTDSLGCVNSNTVIVRVVEAWGLSEQSLTNTFKLFPNPGSSFVKVRSEEFIIGKWCLFDFLGRTCSCSDLKGENEFKVNLEQLTNGIYFLKIEDKTGFSNFRIIKE